jgi:GDP-L-fucose synthase
MNLDKAIYNKNINPMCSHINVGSGLDLTIEELAKTIQKVVGYKGKIEFDLSKPDGMKKKLLDSKRINSLGWKPEVSLQEGLMKSYEDFKKNI